ncbi:hypothetical protein [Portibacter marinus]|uniref:hypothetical protein n=1 Tax=Portibacter marinus TaxID=2898660 RepID=UPI001F1D2C72|nr:hypothetical protein [Portibacter marinus]
MQIFKAAIQSAIFFLILIISFSASGQNVGIGTNSPHPSAILELNSDTSGILIPRMTAAQRDAISSPTDGLLVYVTEDHSFYYCFGAQWYRLGDRAVLVSDTDNDTKLQVEESADEDILRIDLGGTEYLNIDEGRINVVNTGNSVFIGNGAGANDDFTMNDNIAVGEEALHLNTTGIGNIAVGSYSLRNNESGQRNTAVGAVSLYNNIVGGYNTGLGTGTLFSNLNGSSNVALGNYSLYQNTAGNGNTAIGTFAGENTIGGGGVFIGYKAGMNEIRSNRLYIENSEADSTAALIFGNFETNFLRINGTLDVNGAYKMPEIDGSAGQILATDGAGSANWTDPTPESILVDLDNDTKIQVEESNDEDRLRIDLGGTEYFIFDRGRIDVVNTGNSVFLGFGTGASDDLSNNQNTAIGTQSLVLNSTGIANSALGMQSLVVNTTGANNLALGAYGLWSNRDGNSNIAAGYEAMYLNVNGSSNTAVGDHVMRSNRSGNRNSALGHNALYRNQTGNGNTALGSEAGFNVLGDSSVFIGITAGRNETAGHRLYIENSPADETNALIYGEFDNDLLRVNGTLNINSAYNLPQTDGSIGQILTTDGAGNANWTDQVLTGAITDIDNDTKIQVEEIADEDQIRFDLNGIEYFVMDEGRINVLNTGESVFIGQDAGMLDDLTSNKNVFVGFESGKANTIGGQNVALGYRAMSANTSGFNNSALGLNALLVNTTGHNNTAVGIGALSSVTGGIFNTAVGSGSGNNTNGSNNVSVGNRSLFSNTTGSSNVSIGASAGHNATGSGGIFLGFSAGFNETQSNRLYIENSSADANNALIYGEFDNDYLRVNGHLSIRNGFSDGDKDTKIQVEEGLDDDIIRFDIAGEERFIMRKGRLDFLNDAGSVFIGKDAGLVDDLIFGGNVGIGDGALMSNTSGGSNVAIGRAALNSNTTANSNVGIGPTALFANTIGNSNVAVGASAGSSTIGSGSIFIGTAAGKNEVNGNRLYIEPTSAGENDALIFGDFGTDRLKLNGSVKIYNRNASKNIFEVTNAAMTQVLVVGEDKSIAMPAMATGTGNPVNITASGKLVRNTSTRRDKRNIEDFEVDFNKVLGVQPRRYNRPHSPEIKEIGYIAEEMDSLGLHELVVRSEEGVIEGIFYDKIVLYTNEIVKQHDKEISKLKDMVASQQALIERQSLLLEKLLNSQKASVAEQKQVELSDQREE